MRPLNHRLSALACAITVLATVAVAENVHENDLPDLQGADSANTATRLLDSIERDDVDAVAALLARGVDVDARARFRGAACCLTALGLAALRHRLDIATLLIEAGADVNARGLYGGPTPLHWAAAERARDTAEALLAAGADVNAVAGNDHHRTPLHMAVDRMFADDGVAQLLIGRGANVNARTKSGETPLHQAVWRSRHRLATALLDAGADVDAMNVNGRTPLHFAAHRGAVEAVKVLLAAGATADSPRRGDTPSPLLMAVRSKEEWVALLLIEHGADVNAQTRLGGWTPLHLALNVCCADGIVAAALRAAGGEDRAGGDAEPLPIITWGTELQEGFGVPDPSTGLHTDRTSNLYSRPTMFMLGAEVAAQGSFSAAGVNERLVVEPLGWSSYIQQYAYLTGLIDKDGRTRLLWVSDSHTRLLTLCRDAETGTDHAVFGRTYGGTVPGDIVFMAYDAERGTLVESYWTYEESSDDELFERQTLGMSPFACPPRDKQ